MSYGDNIRKLRKANHMNQTELGKLLNVSNKAISSWESDRTEPNMEMINAMCRIFKCGYSELMFGEASPHALDLSQLEHDIIVSYRKADTGRQEAVLHLLDIDIAEKNEEVI